MAIRLILRDDDSEGKKNESDGIIGRISSVIEGFGKAASNLFKITMIFIIMACIFSLGAWILNDENGIIIKQFQVEGLKNVSGENIADLLVWNLDEIQDLNGLNSGPSGLNQRSALAQIKDGKSGR